MYIRKFLKFGMSESRLMCHHNYSRIFVKNMQTCNQRVNDLDPKSSIHFKFLFHNASEMFSV